MARFAPAAGAPRTGRAPHPARRRVFLAAHASWTTMPWRWVDAARDNDPPAAAAARV